MVINFVKFYTLRYGDFHCLVYSAGMFKIAYRLTIIFLSKCYTFGQQYVCLLITQIKII